MTRRKYEYLTFKSPKYRCFCGIIHVQTLTKIACVILLLICAYDTYNYMMDLPRFGHDYWLLFKIIVAFAAAVGPLIGIKKTNSIYFYGYFFPTIVVVFYYCYILFSVCAGFEIASIKEEYYDLISDADMESIQTIFPNFTFTSFLFWFITILLIFEVLVFYVIYKCYKYIEALSLQGGEYGYQAKKHGKSKINNSKEITKDTKPLINLSEAIKKYSDFSFIESIFVKNKTPSLEIKHQPKPRTSSAAANVDPKIEPSKSTEVKPIQQPKIATTNSKPSESNLEIHLKNSIIQEESTKTKFAEKVVEKVAKKISLKNPSKPKTTKSIQHSKVDKKEISKPIECNLEINLHNYFVQKETTNITVELNSTQVLQKVIKKTSSENSNSSSASESHFQQTSISNFLNPKTLVSTEIQTSETYFDQRIVKKRFKNFDYDSGTDSVSPTTPSVINDEYVTDQKSPITASSGFASTSDLTLSESVSPNTEANVTFLFKTDETCAVEISQNGRKEKVKNLFDNEWTPLYFSMAQKNPEIGEKAQIHFHHFREYVLYDIFKIIGKSMDEIEIDPEWKFKIVEKNGIKYFQIKTQNRLNLFPENIILATCLKSMKGLAENYLNSEIHEINISSNFEISESQKSIFKNAASKIHLKILSFRENNFE